MYFNYRRETLPQKRSLEQTIVHTIEYYCLFQFGDSSWYTVEWKQSSTMLPERCIFVNKMWFVYYFMCDEKPFSYIMYVNVYEITLRHTGNPCSFVGTLSCLIYSENESRHWRWVLILLFFITCWGSYFIVDETKDNFDIIEINLRVWHWTFNLWFVVLFVIILLNFNSTA